MKQCFLQRAGRSRANPRNLRRKFSKSWMDNVALSTAGLFMASSSDNGNDGGGGGGNSGGGDGSGGGGGGGSGGNSGTMAHWGYQNSSYAGSDGRPGYDIYRTLQHSEDSLVDGGVTHLGWNAIVLWNMDPHYLDTLPFYNSGVIGTIYQDVFQKSFLADGTPSQTTYFTRDRFDVYCHVQAMRDGGSSTNYYIRRYSMPSQKDIFLLPDYNIMEPTRSPLYCAMLQWGEAFFIPAGSTEPVGETAVRWLSIFNDSYHGVEIDSSAIDE